MSKKIKILMHAVFDSKGIHAQSRDALHWALYLNNDNIEITAFVFNKPDERLIGKNIRLIKLSKLKLFRLFQIFLRLSFPFFTHVLLATPNPIIIFYLNINKLFSIFKKKIIISLVNRLPYEKKSRKILYNKKFYQFAISAQIQKDFFKITGREIPIVHLIYDLQRFIPLDNKKHDKSIICVGTMQIRKNPFLFANLAKQFPNYSFIWVGNGYYYDWILEKKERASIQNLTLIKKLEQNILAEKLRNSSIFLFPSVHEGFPNVIVEALASGLPVITMSTYGPEAIIDGYNGYVVEDEYEMREKLDKLLQDDQLLMEMSKNARESSLRYEGQNAVKEFEEFLKNI